MLLLAHVGGEQVQMLRGRYFVGVGLRAATAAEIAVGPHSSGHGEEHRHCEWERSPECLLGCDNN